MPVTAGARFGPYEILARIGAGGMGEVYRATDTRLDRVVAIEVLSEHPSKDADLHRRFAREAKTISQLQHPHICTLHDIGREGETDYLVMEFLEGETLWHRLARGPLSLDLLCRYGSEIADALGAAHAAGVIHRDLKPSNVMMTNTGVELIDFGLARPIVTLSSSEETGHATASGPLTEEGAVVPRARSRESSEDVACPRPVDVRRDDGRHCRRTIRPFPMVHCPLRAGMDPGPAAV